MTQHIGIVACSAEGAALCYRTLCAQAPARLGTPHAHPEISLHALSLADYVACLERGDLDGVARLMLRSAAALAAAGADFLICPDNTIHQALPRVTPGSPRPWLAIDEVVADEAARRGFGRLGVLGTHWLVASEVYPRALGARGLQAVRPRPDECERLGRLIMEDLVPGLVRPGTVAAFQAVVERLKREEGCDAVILGCTEIPLILDDANAGLPTLDSTRLLARAALHRAMEAA